jgi:hypothetical protein
LTSKIINMAEKLKDAEDRLLEAMLRSEPIADEGFSGRVVSRIRRRLWVQRLALPSAMLIGGAIAVKPATQLVAAASKLLTIVPQGMLDVPTTWIPQVQNVAYGATLTQTVVLGAMVLAAGVLGTRMLIE